MIHRFWLLPILLMLGVVSSARGEGPATRPTVYIIGDSTVKNGTKGLQGWGDPVAELFDRTRINIDNRARGGRSSRTYLTEGLWGDVLKSIKPGDFVLMQFGHNDGGSLADPKSRASLHGSGEEVQTVTLPDGQTETVHSFGWYLRKYIADTQAKGATPVVFSLIPRCIWADEHHVNRAGNDYGKWARESALTLHAGFVDLNTLIADQYDVIGQTKVKADFFPGDHTHTNPLGAAFNARAVANGIAQLDGCSLKDYLVKPVPAILKK